MHSIHRIVTGDVQEMLSYPQHYSDGDICNCEPMEDKIPQTVSILQGLGSVCLRGFVGCGWGLRRALVGKSRWQSPDSVTPSLVCGASDRKPSSFVRGSCKSIGFLALAGPEYNIGQKQKIPAIARANFKLFFWTGFQNMDLRTKLTVENATDAKAPANWTSRRPESNRRRPGPGFGLNPWKTVQTLFCLPEQYGNTIWVKRRKHMRRQMLKVLAGHRMWAAFP